MTITECIASGKKEIDGAKIQCRDSALHMRQILEHCLSTDASGLYRGGDRILLPEEETRISTFLARRILGEPFQYIAGYEWFWDTCFRVGPGCLIPRRETEGLVEILLKEEKREKVRIAELGAGSGNLGISVLKEKPDWEWFGFELNPDSLPYLRENLKTLPQGAAYHVEAGDFFVRAEKKGPYDWVISNPPYVASKDFAGLAKEIHFEPSLALSGGVDGLDIIRSLVSKSAGVLKPKGRILGELSPEQGERVRVLLEKAGFRDVEIRPDLAGHSRYFSGGWGD